MEDALSKETELNKLRHQLNTEGTTELEFLNKLDFNELQTLRSKITKAVQLEQSPVWSRLANVSKYIPAFLNAKIAEQVVGPQITANSTYYVDAKSVVNIAKHMSVPFLAEVTEHLVPEKAQTLMNTLPLDLLKKIVKQMIKTKNYYTMGNFVDYLEENRIMSLMDYVDDERDIVRISTYAQGKQYMAGFVQHFDDGKILRLLNAAHELGHWGEVLVIAQYLPQEQQRRIANLIPKMSVESLLEAYKEGQRLNLLTDIQVLVDKMREIIPAEMTG